jgi:DNA-binding transcriptional LysR family regulator
VTQSTVSARIQNLGADLGARLFVRNRSGATLTQAGLRFRAHAKTLVLTLEQVRHAIGLPGRYRRSIRIGGRIALRDGFLPEPMATPLIEQRKLFRVANSPEFAHPA